MVKIFVGNLNPSSKSAELRKKFEKFGKVTECDIVNNYAFVHMENESDAKAAISSLHNSDFDGSKINVEHSHGKRGGAGSGGGPMRRRFEQGRGPRDYPPERFRGPPRNYMSGPPPPSSRSERYGQPGWDEVCPFRNYDLSLPDLIIFLFNLGGYDYPPSGPGSRYPPDPVRPREGRAPMMPESGYRSAPSREQMPPPTRDYPPKESRRYDSYDGYSADSYDRYRDSAPAPPSHPRQDYYENYGSYSSGGTAAAGNYDYPYVLSSYHLARQTSLYTGSADYRDSRSVSGAPSSGSYNGGYDYGSYYDYGREGRSTAPPQPSRSGYSYGRP
ncbi:unnamed protein product [Protopolystoma xenopodis]|uniref:RRM domain-containing protein n=1 Tax=Protopolystoma xenopodis TaxID=117903 RepID=A0A3S4ZPN8_9PLAT|nr:unnamed protein product [Protopolystoma xenopodis]